ncbi:Putative flippase GtrA (transmembrane translocase of bactoprenol-linked glucose) (GtrA) (PDB:5MLZ) (PUBMED:24710389) [Commensalibacter communis]|uniref:GtrA family protein n=1 Tax=Commensalibacter communis TaxID=2972786 RepID=UPI0022FF9D11|nr:GtrA family protein [Commensalibacter communis]CAI3927666.1 Putative flippase GtrA (transmembrane translocase of bactoprenol-linked glucose) (GtrA) (PDB:5MLZ) (PUBMED:24710389) [Commensalibacter communis]CAI3931654.1 Putative flippase GtrA (transmembrane translocase of bactoprenol-linked glucose) (GtrA) (PDB:5MLZ) (PUBMED:24710389) [Commensalibacter communis]
MFQRLLSLFKPEKYHTKMTQFIQFGLVGFSGLVLDTCTVYLLRHIIGLTASTLLAYFIAATSNWLINRLWTFRGAGKKKKYINQWLTFLITNIFGFCLNRGSVLILFYFSPTCVAHPIIALVIGAAAGMFANFNLSRKLVYR